MCESARVDRRLERAGNGLLQENPATRPCAAGHCGLMIPGGVDDGEVRKQLLDEFNIEMRADSAR